MGKMVVLAVPGPAMVVSEQEDIERFLALKVDPAADAAAQKRVEKFNKICTVIIEKDKENAPK